MTRQVEEVTTKILRRLLIGVWTRAYLISFAGFSIAPDAEQFLCPNFSRIFCYRRARVLLLFLKPPRLDSIVPRLTESLASKSSPRCQPFCNRQSARRLQSGRPPANSSYGQDLCVRLHPAGWHSGQRPGADPDVSLLVRDAEGLDPDAFSYGGRGRVSRTTAGISGFNLDPAGRCWCGGPKCFPLNVWRVVILRVPGGKSIDNRNGMRDSDAERAYGRATAAGADFYSGHQGTIGTR